MVDEPKLRELDKLIAKGKQKGYLTYDEVNDALPSDVVSLDQLDDIMLMFGSMDIELVDSTKGVRLPSEIEPPAETDEDDTTDRRIDTANVAWFEGDDERAVALCREALALVRTSPSKLAVRLALASLGMALARREPTRGVQLIAAAATHPMFLPLVLPAIQAMYDAALASARAALGEAAFAAAWAEGEATPLETAVTAALATAIIRGSWPQARMNETRSSRAMLVVAVFSSG